MDPAHPAYSPTRPTTRVPARQHSTTLYRAFTPERTTPPAGPPPMNGAPRPRPTDPHLPTRTSTSGRNRTMPLVPHRRRTQHPQNPNHLHHKEARPKQNRHPVSAPTPAKPARNTTKYLIAGVVTLVTLIAVIILITNLHRHHPPPPAPPQNRHRHSHRNSYCCGNDYGPAQRVDRADRLREMADGDRSFVAMNLADRWVCPT